MNAEENADISYSTLLLKNFFDNNPHQIWNVVISINKLRLY